MSRLSFGRRSAYLVAVLGIGAALALSACSGVQNTSTRHGAVQVANDTGIDPKAPKHATIGLISYNIASPGIKLYHDIFIQQAQKIGWTVKSVDTNGDAVAAVNQVKQWVSEKVNAIVVDTIPNTLMAGAISAAQAAGIPWFSVSSGWVPGVTNDVGANDWASGAELTTALIAKMGYKGNILKFDWEGLPAVAARSAGFDAVLKSFPQVHLLKNIELKIPGWADDAYQQTLNYLQSHKDVNAIWLPWDDFATNVVRAIQQSGMANKIIVGGFDLDPSAADLLRQNGPFQMSNALNIPAFAVSTINLLSQKLAGKAVPTATYVPNCLATPQNIPATGGREQLSFWRNCYGANLALEK